MKRTKIVFIGGGSVLWAPKILNDLSLTKGLEEAEFVLLDLDLAAAEKVARLGRMLSRKRGLGSTFRATDVYSEALPGADFVVVAVSTGGLDAMRNDLLIPEEYRIYATVGDTAGPGAWSRTLRTAPVFLEMAGQIRRCAPQAMVLNYTNTMGTLTNLFCRASGLTTIGLCHGIYDVYRLLKAIFHCEEEREIRIEFGGLNHFFFVRQFYIRGEEGYPLLWEKMKGKKFSQLIPPELIEGEDDSSLLNFTDWAIDTYRVLPFPADRHIVEFFPTYLTGSTEKLDALRIHRTTIEERWEQRRRRTAKLDSYLAGTESLPDTPSREAASDIIGAVVNNGEYIDVVNLPNIGQVPELPLGVVVETLGAVRGKSVLPLAAGPLPGEIVELLRPFAALQEDLVEAILRDDLEEKLAVLERDPYCAHLTREQAREMGERLLKANQPYIDETLERMRR